MRQLLAGLFPLLLASCSFFQKPSPPPQPQPQYQIHPERYAALRPSEARIRIDLTTQKARLLNRHQDIVIETDVSTGKPGHETPVGIYRIMEKIEEKRSNRYGRYRDLLSGADLGASADFLAPPKGAIYEGYQMPFWMRLTSTGIGIHVGHVVPQTAVSYGCIRVPKDIQPQIFEKCRVGTRVEVIQTPPPPPAPTPPSSVRPENPLTALFRTR